VEKKSAKSVNEEDDAKEKSEKRRLKSRELKQFYSRRLNYSKEVPGSSYGTVKCASSVANQHTNSKMFTHNIFENNSRSAI
jgi:hypothetical protein